ncbi:winged helix-turn-helix domain-containing protein [Thermomonas sp.]|uniref:winged helix-turn-helix domain-containing protein n=1 Tax=Thermomonas sp. TaxID=1971895 RepID=UPI00248A0819|nr:winged helix-turn-helix domain-containing protein [Thermomonas sp.]MDI1252361.1 winged helix-turn-helix domain-containing protein [Thermomonas sp.]
MTESRYPPWPAATQRLRIAELQIDLRYRLLLGDGEPQVELPQRVFDLLVLFLAEPHVLHSRAELFERVWQDVVVEDANLSQTVWLLRKALGPDRKSWVRTVAKGGFVFEPPSAPEVLDETATVPTEDLPATETIATTSCPPATDSLGQIPATAVRRRPVRWLAGALLVLVVALGVGSWLRTHQTASPETAPVRKAIAVALVDVRDPAAGGDARWPGRLLHAWLEWKLMSLPEVVLLSEADLSSKLIDASPDIVLISSGQLPGHPDQAYVRARISGGADQLQLSGPQAQVPQMVDQLSVQLVQRLLPGRAATQWPELALDPQAARRFVDAYDAHQRRDWVASVQAGKEVVARAPGFGLARLQMAQALSKLGQAAPAQAQVSMARKNLNPLPPETSAVLAAWQLGLDPQRPADAARAYARLAQRYPHKTEFALQQANFLARSGELEQARTILTRPDWEQQPIAMRIDQLLALADVDGNLGNRQRARNSAQDAYNLAEAAGDGWSLERGNALLVLAQIDAMQHQDKADFTLYERAAEAFASGGDEFDALLARVLGETAHPTTNSRAHMDQLLAEARAGGYRNLEIGLLLRVGMQQFAAGHHAAYRERLQQALAIAIDSGNTLKQEIVDLHLLNDDLLRADLAGAARRITRLHNSHLQGTSLAMVDQYEASVDQIRGRYAHALAVIDRSQRAAVERGRPLPPYALAEFDCQRGELLLQQGRLAQARAAWTQCADAQQADNQWQMIVGRANSDLVAGDRASALKPLQVSLAQLRQTPDGPDRWIMSINLAPLLARAGDLHAAASLYPPVVQGANAAGYDLLLALAKTGMAEVAAARGQWAASTTFAADARKLIPADAWIPDYRLREVEMVDAMARGDRVEASNVLEQLDAMAHRLGDVQVQMEAHSLMSANAVFGDCTPAARSALAARTGLRGANLAWLTASLPIMAKAPLMAASDPATRDL